MAIDPKLLVIKPVNEIETTNDPLGGQVLIYDGDSELKKASLQSIKDEVVSGIKGEAIPSTVPTPWTSGDPDLYEKYDVKTAATYTNFKDASNASIVVSSVDLEGNLVQIWVKNGVAEKNIKSLPQATQYIPDFVTSTFPIVGPAQRTYNGSTWEIPLGVSAQSNDIPEVGSIWNFVSIPLEPREIIDYSAYDLQDGYVDNLGNIITPPDPVYGLKYTATPIPVNPNQTYEWLTGGLSGVWLTSGDVFISAMGDFSDPTGVKRFKAPANAAKAIINKLNTVNDTVIINITNQNVIEKEIKITNSQIVKSAFKDLVRSYSNIFDFSLVPIVGNIIVTGDSTIANYLGGTAISDILYVTGTKTSIAVPGNTINQQLAIYNALDNSIKNNANYIFIQLGLNDVSPTDSSSIAIGRMQNYVNAIKSQSPNAKIIICSMLPCKGRWSHPDLGYTLPQQIKAQENWEQMNFFFMNGVANVDLSIDFHTEYLSDGAGNLDSMYDVGDAIHENTAGRKIIAYSWICNYLK